MARPEISWVFAHDSSHAIASGVEHAMLSPCKFEIEIRNLNLGLECPLMFTHLALLRPWKIRLLFGKICMKLVFSERVRFTI